MRNALILAISLPLAACGSLGGVVVPKEVPTAVPVPCIKPDSRPRAPLLRSQAELDQLPDYHWAFAMDAERLKLIDYARELEAVVEGCSRIPELPRP
jgi:hypothetical protein